MTIQHQTVYIATFLGPAEQQPGAKSFRTNIYFILRLIIGKSEITGAPVFR
jgi:hypothetical protein